MGDKHQSYVVLTVMLILLAAMLLAGCGVVREQAKTTQIVETEKTVTAPITFDTPFGQFVAQPTTITRQRVQDEVEKTTGKTSISLPDPTPLLAAISGGTPWGAIVASVIGAAVAAFTAKRAIDNGRQRDEVIDGVESAKDLIDPETWGKVRKTLHDNQSDDTVKAVAKRTA